MYRIFVRTIINIILLDQNLVILMLFFVILVITKPSYRICSMFNFVLVLFYFIYKMCLSLCRVIYLMINFSLLYLEFFHAIYQHYCQRCCMLFALLFHIDLACVLYILFCNQHFVLILLLFAYSNVLQPTPYFCLLLIILLLPYI